jgi:hypothetical protein
MEQQRHQTGEAVNDPYFTLIQRIKKCRDFLGDPCVIKVIVLACFTYIDIFNFIKSLLTYWQ